MNTNLNRKSIPNSGRIKSKGITKLYDRLLSKRVEFWNNKEIFSNLTVPGTVRTTVRIKICSQILGKTSVKKLVNTCGCFKH